MSEALAEPVAPAEPTAVAPEAAPPPEPAAQPSWDDPALLDLVDTRAQGLVRQQLEPLIPLLERVLGGTQDGGGKQVGQLVDEFGQLDPNALVQLLSEQQRTTLAQIDERIQQIQAPLAARFEQETVAEGEQRLQDILADDIARHGEFSADKDADAAARKLVRTIADQVFPEIAQRYGPTPRAAEMAMSAAATQVREVLAADRKSALSTEQNRINALAGVRGEPGVTGAGVEGLSDKPLSSRELAMKYGSRATALTRA